MPYIVATDSTMGDHVIIVSPDREVIARYFTDEDDLRRLIERGQFDSINDAIQEDVERNMDSDSYAIDAVTGIELFDEDGETVEL